MTGARRRTQPVRVPAKKREPAPEPIVRLIAELLDGIHKMDGSYAPTLIEQAERACRKAKLDPAFVNQACRWLDEQDRI